MLALPSTTWSERPENSAEATIGPLMLLVVAEVAAGADTVANWPQPATTIANSIAIAVNKRENFIVLSLSLD